MTGPPVDPPGEPQRLADLMVQLGDSIRDAGTAMDSLAAVFNTDPTTDPTTTTSTTRRKYVHSERIYPKRINPAR